MRTLFNLKPPSQYGVLHSVHWPYVRDGLRRNLEAILRYHRKNPQAVKGSHFLVRLLGSISVPLSMNLERYYENVDAGTFDTASALKMTSAISYGSIFKGVFYGPGCSEVLIAHNTSFDITDADRNWMNLQPITVLRHPRSDLAMNLPDGRATGSETGVVVIAINIPMLAVMYRAFYNYEMKYVEEGARLSMYHFLKMFVIPNMLASHLDIALFNRIDNLQKGAPLGESKEKHSFALADYTKKVNQAQDEVLTYLKTKKQDFLGMLHTVPAVIKNDMSNVMELPDIVATRQAGWALVLARMDALSFVYRAAGDNLHTINQAEVNATRRALTSYRADNVFKTALPINEYINVAMEMDEIYGRAFS